MKTDFYQYILKYFYTFLSDAEKIECPPSFQPLGLGCYFFSEDNDTRTWFNAQAACRNMNSDLVVVNSKSEYEALSYYEMIGKSLFNCLI